MSRARRTYRRRLLDTWLTAQAPLLSGVVVDIGGKRDKKRGEFRPNQDRVTSWMHVNIDEETSPDVLADAAQIPLADGVANAIVCTETLEHVPSPERVVAEMHRLLCPGGVVVASVPFLFPIHADPYDFQRFTARGLALLFSSFSQVTITPMGGTCGTLAMLLELAARDGSEGWLRRLREKAASALALPGYWLDRRGTHRLPDQSQRFTTGYGILATKGS